MIGSVSLEVSLMAQSGQNHHWCFNILALSVHIVQIPLSRPLVSVKLTLAGQSHVKVLAGFDAELFKIFMI